MNLNDYAYFEILAQTRNVTRAAEQVGLTQQALSAKVSRLERYYNVKLFDRENRFALTYAGERLLEHCRMLNLWSIRTESEMHDIASGDSDIIHIGATAKRGYTMIPPVFRAFYQEWPLVRVNVVESAADELIPNILNRKTDFCFLVSKTDDPRIQTEAVFEDRLQLFISDQLLQECCGDHLEEILSRENQTLPIRYFAGCPFCLQGNPVNRVRLSCIRLFEQNGIIPNIVFSATNAMTLLEVVLQGIGAAFLVSSTKIVSGETLHRFYIEGLSQTDFLNIAWLQGTCLSRHSKHFIELTREILPKQFIE